MYERTNERTFISGTSPKHLNIHRKHTDTHTLKKRKTKMINN